MAGDIFTPSKICPSPLDLKNCLKAFICRFTTGQNQDCGRKQFRKSTLLRIMAGKKKDFMEQAGAQEGRHAGVSATRAPVGQQQDRPRGSRRGLSDIKALLAEYDKVSKACPVNCRPTTWKNVGADGKASGKIEAVDGWEFETPRGRGHGLPRAAPDDTPAACCRAARRARGPLQTAAQKPDMLLLDEPTNPSTRKRWPGLNKRSQRIPGQRHCRHPRPVLPRQHHPMDFGVGPAKASPLRAATRNGSQDETRRRRTNAPPRCKHLQKSWNGCQTPSGRRARTKRALPPTNPWPPKTRDPRRQPWILKWFPARAGRQGRPGRRSVQGYGENQLLSSVSFDIPRGIIVGLVGPNRVGKTTLFRMITGQEKPDAHPGRWRLCGFTSTRSGRR